MINQRFVCTRKKNLNADDCGLFSPKKKTKYAKANNLESFKTWLTENKLPLLHDKNNQKMVWLKINPNDQSKCRNVHKVS